MGKGRSYRQRIKDRIEEVRNTAYNGDTRIIDNANPEGCNQYKSCEGLESGHIHILEQLKGGEKSIQFLHKLQPGMASARGMYHTTVMPAQDLERKGLIEKTGVTKGNIGVGASYAGPGSAPTSAEKDDPARHIYKLTDKGRELVGLKPEVKEEEPEYSRHDEYKSQKEYLDTMIAVTKSQLAKVKGKPRLEKEAREKLDRYQKGYNKLKIDFADIHKD